MIKKLLLLSGWLLSSSTMADVKAEHQIQRFSKDIDINQPTLIRVVNHYGDIRIRKADDNRFIYHGVAQSGGQQKVTLDFQQSEGEITAIIKYSDPEKTNHLDRYDLALIVPEQATLDIEIERGKLSTKGLNSAIKVRSKHSDLKVKTNKTVDLFSEHGNIEWQVKPATKLTENNIQSYSGLISVIYLEESPKFKIITGNHVTTNSSSLLMSQKKEGRTRMYGNEKHNHLIHIKNDTGPINLIDLAQ